ncbi:hypothetical protein ABIE89_000193 [Bradyrhizobium niftali]
MEVHAYPAEHNRLFEPVETAVLLPQMPEVCASIAAGAVHAKSSTTGRSSQGHH